MLGERIDAVGEPFDDLGGRRRRGLRPVLAARVGALDQDARHPAMYAPDVADQIFDGPVGARRNGRVDARVLSGRLGMPLVHDEEAGLYALGPESGGRALTSAEVTDFTLPDWQDGELTLSELRGQKVLLICWASW